MDEIKLIMTEIIAEIANSHQGSPRNAEKLAIKSLELITQIIVSGGTNS